MGTCDDLKTWNWPLILRLLSIACGVGTIVTGFFSLITEFRDFPAALIINLYMMAFACLIVLAELRVRPMLKHFTFLQTYRGRGVFYCFVSTMCFIYISVGAVFMGVVLAGNGIVHLIFVATKHPAYLKELEELRTKGYIDSEVAGVANQQLNEAAKRQMKQQLFGTSSPSDAGAGGGGASGAPPSV